MFRNASLEFGSHFFPGFFQSALDSSEQQVPRKQVPRKSSRAIVHFGRRAEDAYCAPRVARRILVRLESPAWVVCDYHFL